MGGGSAGQPRLLTSPTEMRDEVLAARAAGRRVGFVPTMGALHAGHASLVDRATADCHEVAVSIFVNPTQFGPGEDYGRYPRMLEADTRLLERRGVRWIFAPRVEDLYPAGAATRVVVEGPALPFEGAIRPGHFSGVATVVCRLFTALPADAAYFGAKDWQQTLVVKRMVRDLGLPVDIVVCPTMREPDGLALSSRNAYLDAADRGRAVALHESLLLAERLWHAGAAVDAIERGMRDVLEAHGVALDYAAVVAAESLGPVPSQPTAAVALVAGRLGSTRLIDNRELPPRPSAD
ncbi:MAG: pantoate--beta-alanine ligase [Planctomycetota bacterium]|nr:MAG: pantoate--beta-alanine ligase [Planctomycetota bacterium]